MDENKRKKFITESFFPTGLLIEKEFNKVIARDDAVRHCLDLLTGLLTRSTD